MDDNIIQFKDFTGCNDDDEARRYIELYEHDLERAIEGYFVAETQVTQNLGSNQPNVVPSNNELNQRRNDEIEIPNDDFNDNDEDGYNLMDDDDDISSDDDLNFYSSTSNILNQNISDSTDDIRRPIEPVQGQLLLETFEQTWRPERRNIRSSIFQSAINHENIDDIRDSSSSENKKHPLEKLFEPPIDILFIGSWETTKSYASSKEKWLLVNLQNNSDFSCACLNRDIWSNDTIKDLIKENFIFWQVGDDSSDFIRVSAYYQITKYPTVMMIDPRTGEKVKHFVKLNSFQSFVDELTDFMIAYPDYESYDQYIANMFKIEDSTDDDDQEDDKTQENKEDDKTEEQETEVKDSEITEELNKIPVDVDKWKEYIGACNSTTKLIEVMFKLPNNERKKIELPQTSPLKALFLYIDGQGYDSNNHVFNLFYPKREYTINDNQYKTLQELSFNKQELIHVNYK